MLLGVYDYTVILTYMSLCSSIAGMFCAFCGHLGWAVACLAFSGLLDGFDGKVARTKKNRTEVEKEFGIEIDSLCDLVCFGALPVVICWHAGMCGVAGMVILALYCLAGLIRLAWFDVMEKQRQSQTSENRRHYQGMPITSIAVILPVLYALSSLLGRWWLPVLHGGMLLTGALFIINFRFPKPGKKTLWALIAVTGAVVLYILLGRIGYAVPWKGIAGGGR